MTLLPDATVDSKQTLQPGLENLLPLRDNTTDSLPKPFPSQRTITRVAIHNNGRILFLNLSDIFAVVAQGNYVLLRRESGSYRLREAISSIAEKLEPHGFVRIHRSVLVNKRWVEEIRPCQSGEHVLYLKGQKEFMVTRTYKKNLKALVELWLGKDRDLGTAGS